MYETGAALFFPKLFQMYSPCAFGYLCIGIFLEQIYNYETKKIFGSESGKFPSEIFVELLSSFVSVMQVMLLIS